MNVLKDGEIWLHGTVGVGLFRDGFTAADVSEALSSIGSRKPVTVHLNSGGGIATEGAAIFAVLSQHAAPKKIVIEGVAASAGSLIAMSGDEVIMKKGSVMMIHDPSGITAGTSQDHEKTIEALEALANSMAEIYADKSGKSVEEARADMQEEIWLTPAAAKKMGYADRIDSAKSKPIAAFDYRLYANAPDSFTAMAESRGWDIDGDGEAGSAADDEETEMSDSAKKGGATNGVATDTPEFKAAVAEAVTAALKAESDKAAKEVADKAAAEAANKGTETTEQITARVRQEEQKRMADITAACTLAGQTVKAADFIANGKSLSEVVAALQEDRAKGTNDKGKGQQQAAASGQELNNHRTGAQPTAGGDFDVGGAWKRTTDKINARTDRQMKARQLS